MAEPPGIALIGTLDTKGAEIAYVRDRLLALGTRPLVVDSGILGEADGCEADVPRAEVARAAGHELEAVRGAGPQSIGVLWGCFGSFERGARIIFDCSWRTKRLLRGGREAR